MLLFPTYWKNVPNHQPDIFWLSVISPPSSSWSQRTSSGFFGVPTGARCSPKRMNPGGAAAWPMPWNHAPLSLACLYDSFTIDYWSTMALVEAPVQSMASAREASNGQKTLDPLRTTACPRPCLCPPTCSFQGPSVTMEAPPCVCRWSQCYTSPISCEKTWSVHLLDSRVDPLAEIPWWIHYTSTIIINYLHTSIQYSEHSPDIYTSIIYSRSTNQKQHCS